MKTAFVFSDKFGDFFYGSNHPMKPFRLRLTYELIEALGLFKLRSSSFIEAKGAAFSDLLLFHTEEYLKVLKEANTGIIPVKGSEHGLGYQDNPVFKGVFDWACLYTGATIQAAELVASGKHDAAFNISGGLHHAMPARASGFCYINDAAIAIKRLVSMGKRVAYIDIDAHHGDGVEYAFYDSKDVLTISLHESGHWLFPGTGFATDIGINSGKGFSVNLPLPPEAGDELFLMGFNEIVPPFIEAFEPDIIVTQLGVDTFASDPITHLNLTTKGFEEMIKRFYSFERPWVALGGGGYNLGNVARAWTIAWAIMNGVEAPNVIPKQFIEKHAPILTDEFLRDREIKPFKITKEELAALKNDIEYLKKEVLPIVKKH